MEKSDKTAKVFFVSRILFNIFAVLLILVNVIGVICGNMERFITDMVFGGYQTITKFSEDSIVFDSDYNSVRQVKAASLNVCNASASEGAVLLKNDGVLPLAQGSKLSLYSISSVQPLYGGGGGAIVCNFVEQDKVYFTDGLEAAGLTYNEDLYDWYDRQWGTFGRKNAVGNGKVATIDEVPWNMIDESAKTQKADVGVFVLSRSGREAIDLEDSYLQLDENEKSVLEGMKAEKEKGTFTKILLLLNTANQVDLDFLEADDYGIDAVLWMGLPGTSGLYGICDMLAGHVTPSGKLPDTWYNDIAYDPSTANYGDFKHANDGLPYVVYQEGVYLGYRYAETRYEDVVTKRPRAGEFDYKANVQYPFGYGLSYTTFEYSDYSYKYEPSTDEYVFNVTVKNSGSDYSGKEVVELYLQKPYTDYSEENNIEVASVELVGFAKTKKLKPGETQPVEIRVPGKSLAVYDAYGEGTYYLDAGDYYFALGNGSHDAVNNILAAKGKTTADGMTEDGNSDFAIKYTVEEPSATLYSTVTTNGVETEVRNLFDYGDINRLNDGVNSVEYYSRSDWQGTLPALGEDGKYYASMHAVINGSDKITEQHSTDRGNAILKKDENGNDRVYKLEEVMDDGREYPKYNVKNDIQWQDMRWNAETGELIPYDDPKWQDCLDQLSWEQTCTIVLNGLRSTALAENEETGFVYPGTYDPNGPTGVMQEGWGIYGNTLGTNGFANLYDDPDKKENIVGYPCPSMTAATFNTELYEAVGRSMGEEALWSGINGVYAFTVNLHRNALHGRACESFSEDSTLSGMAAAYMSAGCREKGLNVYTKHIVLNEQETNRCDPIPHESWISEQALREVYLKPYDMAIRIGGARNVMTSLARVGAVWSGHSRNLMTDWLRGEAGLEGSAITDWYMSAYMSIKGGILCGQDFPDGNWLQGELDFAEGGGASAVAWAMREAAHRIMYSSVQGNRVNGLAAGTAIDITVLTPTWVKVKNGIMIAANILGCAAVVFFAVSAVLYAVRRSKNGKSVS